MNTPFWRGTAAVPVLVLFPLLVILTLHAGNDGAFEAEHPTALYADGHSGSDRYGAAVATDGTTVLVGAPNARPSGDETGAAYAFIESDGEWTSTPLLPAMSLRRGAEFGVAVAVDVSLAVVGAPGAYNGRGAVFLFSRSGDDWLPAAVLVAPPGARFGASVAISGTTIVVGAPGDENGAAFVYTNPELDEGADSSSQFGWVAHELEPPSGADDEFGASVAAADGLIAVGAPSAKDGAGTVTIYEAAAAGWEPSTPPIPSDTGTLGRSVALDPPYLVAGAPASTFHAPDGTDKPRAGRVFVWERLAAGEWTQPTEPLTEVWTPPRGVYLGQSVATSGGVVSAGMRKLPAWGPITLSAFVVTAEIDRPETAEPKIYAQGRVNGIGEGLCISMGNDLLVVGVPNDTTAQWLRSPMVSRGSVWLFHLPSLDRPS